MRSRIRTSLASLSLVPAVSLPANRHKRRSRRRLRNRAARRRPRAPPRRNTIPITRRIRRSLSGRRITRHTTSALPTTTHIPRAPTSTTIPCAAAPIRVTPRTRHTSRAREQLLGSRNADAAEAAVPVRDDDGGEARDLLAHGDVRVLQALVLCCEVLDFCLELVEPGLFALATLEGG